VQGYGDILIDGRSYPLSEFFITVGETGERKSAVDTQALCATREQERYLRKVYQSEKEEYSNDILAFKKAQQHALNKHKSKNPSALKEALKELGPEPVPPLFPILLPEEPTFEGLVKCLREGQPSVGLFSDEGGRFVGGYSMSPEHQLKTISGLCQFWDGKRISWVRSSDELILLYGRRLALHLMVQPVVAVKILENDLLAEQGFLTRCLVLHPPSTAGTREYQEVDVKADPAMMRYWQRMDEIFDTPLPLVDDKRNELDPHKISITGSAKALWIEFHNTVERNLLEGKRFDAIRGFANKAPEHALRLAGILTLFRDLKAEELGLNEVKAGIELTKFYLDEALRLRHSSQADPDIALAKKLLEWAHQQGQYIPLTKIYQNGPNPIRDKKSAKKVVAILVQHGLFRKIEGGKEIDGQNHREVYEVIHNE